MAIAICNCIRLKRAGGSYTGYAYQNFYVSQSRQIGGITYNFLPFAVTNGAGKKGGDRSTTSLVATPNGISVNVFAEASEGDFLMEVKTYDVDVQTLTVQSLITEELWSINRMEFDNEKVILQLVSPLDAVDAQVPRRYLGARLVGSIPTTGRLSMS